MAAGSVVARSYNRSFLAFLALHFVWAYGQRPYIRETMHSALNL